MDFFGDIQSYVIADDVFEIIIDDNYRCAINVIELLNRVRSDIIQCPAKKNPDDSAADKVGSAIFVYSSVRKS